MLTHVKNILTHATHAHTKPTLPRNPCDLADSEYLTFKKNWQISILKNLKIEMNEKPF